MNFLKPKFWDKDQVSFFSILLFPISLCLKLINLFRNIFVKKNKFSIPVICIGNIYLGGTGKTPLSIKLFSILKKLNKNPAFIRKRYKHYQDEINLLGNVGATYESKTRKKALNLAIKNNVNVAILDDGFQDLSIKKDLSIICFNSKQWVGNNFVIPAGPLRENLSSLNRAHFVIINGSKKLNIENKIFENNKFIKIFYTKYIPENISEFKNKKIICFAGIGNPDNFFNLLSENNINLLEKISFPDHYKYSDIELTNLINRCKDLGATLLTTEKDYLRIDEKMRESIQYLKIKLIIENEKQFIDELKKFI
ncbi:MAG: tetraacyldisaccharide 4'-kinase [Euryarchaeota archaeon TMED255]|nr:MAG: tetraacyldisaccharide 4'-kinase [Euryarchaeota archaeon TMED255]